MKVINKSLSDLLIYASNAKVHDEENVELIAASIEQFGFCNPILIDEFNVIIAGHGRLAGAKMAGLKEVPCIVLTHLTAAEKDGYRLADNRLAEHSKWDVDLLTEELDKLAKQDFNLEVIGFSTEEIEALLTKSPVAAVLINKDEGLVRSHTRKPKQPGTVFEILAEFETEAERDEAFKTMKGLGMKCKKITE